MLDTLKKAVNGGGASVLTTTITCPLEVIKMQYQSSNSNVKIPNIIRTIYSTQRIPGFYKGLGTFLVTRPTFFAVMFPLVESLEHVKFSKYIGFTEDSPYIDKIIRYTLAGWGGITATNPLWNIKQELQTQTINIYGSLKKTVKYRNYLQVISDMWNYGDGRVKVFYKGLGPSLIKGTEIGMIFPLTDYLKEHIALEKYLSNSSSCSAVSSMVAGSVAKFTANLITYPLDLIRVHQRKNINRSISIPIAIKELIGEHKGIRKGLYRGLGVYSLASIPQYVILIILYDLIKKV